MSSNKYLLCMSSLHGSKLCEKSKRDGLLIIHDFYNNYAIIKAVITFKGLNNINNTEWKHSSGCPSALSNSTIMYASNCRNCSRYKPTRNILL